MNIWAGQKMNGQPERCTEGEFTLLFNAGSVTGVFLYVLGSSESHLCFELKGGVFGQVVTKRHDLKTYRMQTAIKFLHSIGCYSCECRFRNFSDGQGALV